MIFVPQSKFCSISIANTVYLPTPLKRSKVAAGSTECVFSVICEKVRCVKRCDIHLNFSTRKEIYTEILVLNLEKRGRAGREILVLNLEKAYPTFRVDKHDPEVMSHVLMVVSSEALTTILGLSGLKATQFT